MTAWREKARLVAATGAISSAAWVVAGALWLRPTCEAPQPRAVALSSPVPRPITSQPGHMAIPVSGVTADQLVDSYSDPREGGARVHHAIDIMAPIGTPVVAALAGHVDKLFLSREGGNTIYIRTPDGRTMTYYAHLSAYAPALAEGQDVRAGQVIGAVGASGNADPAAPHLHFEVLRTRPGAPWNDGEAVNPFPLLRGLP